MRHVPADYPTIQAGIDAAAPGDTVLIACGRYAWSTEGTGSSRQSFACGLIWMKSGVTLRGATGDPACVTIDAEGRGEGIICYRVDSSAAIEGLTVTGCTLFGGRSRALYLRVSSPRISDCIIENSGTEYYGPVSICARDGGLGSVPEPGDEVVFQRCRFRHNSGYSIIGTDKPLRLEDCVFESNDSATQVALQATPGNVIANCTFWDNSGRVLQVGDAAVTMSNCTVSAGAPAPYRIAGVFACINTAIPGRPALTVDRCILAFDASVPLLDCLLYESSCDLTMTCCDVFAYGANPWSGCVADQEGVNGNFTADPLWCNPAAGDFSLAAASPCLPGQHPEGWECGIIGADGYGTCARALAGEASTWGQVRSLFR